MGLRDDASEPIDPTEYEAFVAVGLREPGDDVGWVALFGDGDGRPTPPNDALAVASMLRQVARTIEDDMAFVQRE